MKLVLVRHGESEWNLQNRFTGWVDLDLTEKGISEAKAAGKTLIFPFTNHGVLMKDITVLYRD